MAKGSLPLTESGPDDHSLLPTELGLLTVAERRGVVIIFSKTMIRGVVPGRRAMLERLVARGLLAERNASGKPSDRVVFDLTEKGRNALAIADRPAKLD